MPGSPPAHSKRYIGAYEAIAERPLDEELVAELGRRKRRGLKRVWLGLALAATPFYEIALEEAGVINLKGVHWSFVCALLGAMLVGMFVALHGSIIRGVNCKRLRTGKVLECVLIQEMREEIMAQQAVGALKPTTRIAEHISVYLHPVGIARVAGEIFVHESRGRFASQPPTVTPELDGVFQRRL